ncbi:MAG: Putative pre-16S rRNA nuclease [Cryomorphaceae bacterium]|nr:MAG: Putative pre-16S rRNA nuclease [Cryomorphaceae bacterium]
MAKILALDIGGKRTGLAETDPLQMMAFPLKTVLTADLMPILDGYIQEHQPEIIVVGDPSEFTEVETDSTRLIQQWVAKISARFPKIQVVLVDESDTSKLASQTLIAGGMKKSKRREKGALDKVAASLILERFLAQR